jgi:ppGpp synthetase/RelA/SpoT-type nucleotidyltranferase
MNEQFGAVRSSIEGRLKYYLDRAGMYYRIFSRSKTEESIKRKIEAKGDDYRRDGKKMQDLIGVRVVFYFQDDVTTFHNKLKTMPGYDPKNESNSTKELEELSEVISNMDDDAKQVSKKLKKLLPFYDKVFMPERLNIVMAMDDKEKSLVELELESHHDYDTSLVDYTYEVQLRTVLSEGWHEVEHDLRYKTKDEAWWEYCGEESRMLNGLYASLETSESSLSRMIEEIAYKNYQKHSWDAMIRFHFRRRTSGSKLSEPICSLLDSDERLAKILLNVKREELVKWLWDIIPLTPITTDILFFLINRKCINRDDIKDMESLPIKSVLDKMV